MPTFSGGVTPQTKAKPVTFVLKGGTGNTRRTQFFPPADATFNQTQLRSLADAYATLSNAGLVRIRGAGETIEINEAQYVWNDDKYSLTTPLVCAFVADDQVTEVKITLYAPKLRHMSGKVLNDRADDALVEAFAAAGEALLSTGAATYTFAGGAFADAGKVRTTTTPTDTTPA